MASQHGFLNAIFLHLEHAWKEIQTLKPKIERLAFIINVELDEEGEEVKLAFHDIRNMDSELEALEAKYNRAAVPLIE